MSDHHVPAECQREIDAFLRELLTRYEAPAVIASASVAILTIQCFVVPRKGWKNLRALIHKSTDAFFRDVAPAVIDVIENPLPRKDVH